MATTGIRRIRTKGDLKVLADELGVRPDWHEPDEQGLTALVFGENFDNAGHWGLDFLGQRQVEACKRLWNPRKTVGSGEIEDAAKYCEIFIVLYKDDQAIAEVDLATLFAFACDTYKG